MRGWALPAAAVVVALAGCGGSDSTPLSRAELVRRADALCQASNDRQADLAAPKDLAGLVTTIQPARADLQKTVDALDGLTPPTELAGDYGKLVATLRDAEGQFDPLLAAAQKQDVAAVAAVVPKINALNQEATTLSKRLGLAACAQS